MACMGWDVDTTLGKLHRFWWWCVDYAEDGDLRKHNDDRLGAAVGVLPGEPAKRFVEAMVKACWLDRKPYFRVHDWWDYIGKFLQIKYKHSPEKWQHVRDLYHGSNNKGKNCSLNGSKTYKPNQPNQPNQPLSNRDREWLAILAEIKGYPLQEEIDIQFLKEKEKDFPEVDIAALLKGWKAYLIDKPFTQKSRPRAQLHTQFELAMKWGKYKKTNGTMPMDASGRQLEYL